MKLEDMSKNQPIAGGLIVKKSLCCNAPLEYSKGGLVTQYCSKCKKIYQEPVFR